MDDQKAQLWLNQFGGPKHDLKSLHVVLGRASVCDLVLQDESVSRKHAIIVWTGDGWRLYDLGASNVVGVRRGEEFLSCPVVLNEGDVLKLGDIDLAVERIVRPDGTRVRPEGTAQGIVARLAKGAQKNGTGVLVIERRNSGTMAIRDAYPLEDEFQREWRGAFVATGTQCDDVGYDYTVGPNEAWLIGTEHLAMMQDVWRRHQGLFFEYLQGTRVGSATAAFVSMREGESLRELQVRVARALGWSARARTPSLCDGDVLWFGDDLPSWERRARGGDTLAFLWLMDPTESGGVPGLVGGPLEEKSPSAHWWFAGETSHVLLATTAPLSEVRELVDSIAGLRAVVAPADQVGEPLEWFNEVKGRASVLARLSETPTPVARIRAELDAAYFRAPEAGLPPLFEATLRFGTLLALSCAIQAVDADAGSQGLLPEWWSWKRPQTAGGLVEVLHRLRRQTLQYPEPLMGLTDPALLSKLQAAVAGRNNLAHQRGSSAEATGDAETIEVALRALLTALDGLGESLLHVESSQLIRGSPGLRTRVKVRKLVGLWPQAPVELLVDGAVVTSGLWLRHADSWTCLSPFLDWAECPECGRWDLFAIRTAVRDGANAVVKTRGTLHSRHDRVLTVVLDEHPEFAVVLGEG